MRPNDKVTFVLLKTGNAYYGFTGYTDDEGEYRFITDKDDRDGRPIPRTFSFRRDKRFISIPPNQKDRRGNSVVKFLKDHPECEGSPNSGGRVAWFKELNTERDAEIVNNSKRIKLDAANAAFNLKGDMLKQAAIVLSGSSTSEALDQHKVIGAAEADPQGFLDMLASPDFNIKSLITEAIAAGELKKTGKIIRWEEVVIGADMEEAISNLMKDNDLRDAITKAVKRIKTKK